MSDRKYPVLGDFIHNCNCGDVCNQPHYGRLERILTNKWGTEWYIVPLDREIPPYWVSAQPVGCQPPRIRHVGADEVDRKGLNAIWANGGAA